MKAKKTIPLLVGIFIIILLAGAGVFSDIIGGFIQGFGIGIGLILGILICLIIILGFLGAGGRRR